jgi:long-chain acyl-CoA synthetase
MNAAQLVIDNLQRFGEYTSLIFEGQEISNSEHIDRACRLATVLADHGVTEDDHVMVMMPTRPEVTAAFHAIWRLGAVIMPVTPQLGPREVHYLLADSGAEVVLTTPATARVVAEAAEGVESVRHVLSFGESDVGVASNVLPLIGSAAGYQGVADKDPEDMAMLLYTSGTTGQPKGVMLSHDNLVTNARAVAAMNTDITPGTRGLIVLPLSHSFGVLAMNLSALFGSAWVVQEQFEVEAVFEAIERYRVQLMPMVPTMTGYLLNFPGRDRFDTSSLRWLVNGAAALPNEVRLEAERVFGCQVLDGYGMSECAASVTGYCSGELFRVGSVGRAIEDVTICIMDPDDNPLSPGEHGEVCVKGPNVMLGYWRNEEATREALRGGWMHSGDIGWLDADGYLYISGSIKDLIIKGGENISPAEIEEAIYQHPAVAQAAVVAVPDPTYGEDIWAVVVPRPGRTVTEDELKKHIAAYVTKFKVPSRVVFREDLPKNRVGKILKRELREELASLATEGR